jgi:hypothetical protein
MRNYQMPLIIRPVALLGYTRRRWFIGVSQSSPSPSLAWSTGIKVWLLAAE